MDPRLKNSICRAIFRETRRLRTARDPAIRAHHPANTTKTTANMLELSSPTMTHIMQGEKFRRLESKPIHFQMPSVTELWGTGVYQEPELHRRSLQRLLPGLLGHYVPTMPSRTEIRKDVHRWLEANDMEGAFQILKALKYQHLIASCSGSEETKGLKVDVVSGFSQPMSQPERDRFVFSYNVRFTNMSPSKTYRIMGRAFLFQNSNGAITSHVRADSREGMGVVGFTPVLSPGDQFVYGSGCTFNTPLGYLSGSFDVIEDRVRSNEFETRNLHDRCEYFKRLAKSTSNKNKKTGLTGFQAKFPILKYDAHVKSLDMQQLMLDIAERGEEDLDLDPETMEEEFGAPPHSDEPDDLPPFPRTA